MSKSTSDKTCWIFLGTTGCGKSSIINTMTKQDVFISHSEISGTKSSGLYQSSVDSNVLLFDTQGAEDTDEVESDEDILHRICPVLAKNSAVDIKVIWCIKPEDKTTPKVKKQARFIHALSPSIWESAILIVKMGHHKSQRRGPLMAIKELGYSKKIPAYNLTCFEWSDRALQHQNTSDNDTEDTNDNKDESDEYESDADDNCDSLMDLMKTTPYEKRVKSGYLHEKEIPNKIIELLNKVKLSKAELKKYWFHEESCKIIDTKIHNKKLEKDYYHESGCTLIKEKKHSENLTTEFNHLGSIKNEEYHDNGVKTENEHNGYLKDVTYHSGNIESVSYHTGIYKSKYYHPGIWRTEHYHSSNTIKYKWAYYLTGYTEWGHNYACCGMSRGSKGCESKSSYSCCGYKTSSGCTKDSGYTCCGKSENSEGCASKTQYTCCSTMSEGCKKKKEYSCCGKSELSEGCKKVRYHKCCELEYGSSPCKSKQIYTCCGNEKNSTGCQKKIYYPCCDGNKLSEGCKIDKEYFSKCGGDKFNKGCKYTAKYLCCNGPENSKPCHLENQHWSCDKNPTGDNDIKYKCSWKYIPKYTKVDDDNDDNNNNVE